MFNFVRNFFVGRANRHDQDILLSALSSEKYEFRSLAALGKKIGTTDRNRVLALIAPLGVRPMYGNPDMIGLIRRIGPTARRYSQLPAHNG